MFIYNKKELDELNREANNRADAITGLADDIINALKDTDRDIESKVEVERELTDSILSKLESPDSPFSERYRNRLRKLVDGYRSDLEDELNDLSVDLDSNDIFSEHSNYRDSEEYLSTTNFYELVELFNNNHEERTLQLDKIDDFLTNPKIKKRHFVMERRSGLVAIKDRKHPDYKINKDKPISIDNGEVYFIANGVWDSFNGWSIPENVIESCRKTVKKLNSL